MKKKRLMWKFKKFGLVKLILKIYVMLVFCVVYVLVDFCVGY